MQHGIAIAALVGISACSGKAEPRRGALPASDNPTDRSGGILARLSTPPASDSVGDAGPESEFDIQLPEGDAGVASPLPYADYEFEEAVPYRPMPRRFRSGYAEANPTQTGAIVGKTAPPPPPSADCPRSSSGVAFLKTVERGRSIFTKTPGVHDHRRHQIGGLLEHGPCGLLPLAQVVLPIGAMVELVNLGDGEVEMVARAAPPRIADQLESPVLGGSREAFRARLVGAGARAYRRLDEPGLYRVDAGRSTAYVAVAPHPYYVAIGPDGVFRIDDIPADTYTLVVWRLRGDGVAPKAVQRTVQVRAGKLTRVSL